MTFTLVGDDSEHDPEVFQEIRQRHPDRIEEIWMRPVNANLTRVRFADQLDFTSLLEPHLTQSS